MRRRTAAAALGAALILAACGGDEGNPNPPGGGAADETQAEVTLAVYSGRKEEFIGPLLDSFTADTGIALDVRYGDSAELAATILEEGQNTPADAFISQEAGALGVVGEAGLLTEIDPPILQRVDPGFRSPAGLWIGTSGRARVAAYNTEALSPGDLPDSIKGFTDPSWKGRIGFPPTNASFQAFVAAMLVTEGREATRAFLEGIVANEPRFYEDNSSTVRAVAAGEIDVGFVNHYYLYEVSVDEGEIPVANHFFTKGDPGALVNATGIGVLAASDHRDEAMTLAGYLTGEEGQTYFADETFEYPVAEGFEPSVELPPLAEIESPDIDLSHIGDTLEPALKLLAAVGLL
jgi:iron(III) transport system substrate-binding protein